MPIADLFLRYRRHFRVAIFALLLITPSQSSQAPNGCPEVATAIRLIGETDWETVQAMMPPEITEFIHNDGLHVMGNAKAYATGAGLVFMSVYLCYKGVEL